MDNKSYGKFIIIALIVLAIYGAFIYFVFGGKKDNKTDNKDNKTNNTNKPTKPTTPDVPKSQIDAIVFINDNGLITHSDTGWEIGSTTILSGKKFDVFNNNSLIGTYRVLYNNVWRLYDSNNSPVKYEGSILGVSTDLDFRNISLYEENVTIEDKSNISDYLDKKKIDYDIDYLAIDRHTYDFNQDGIRDDVLYSVSYSSGLDDESVVGDTFSAIFIKSTNRVQEIYYSKENDLPYRLKAIFNLDEVKYLLFSGEYPADSGYSILLYKAGEKIEKELEDNFK